MTKPRPLFDRVDSFHEETIDGVEIALARMADGTLLLTMHDSGDDSEPRRVHTRLSAANATIIADILARAASVSYRLDT